MKIYSSFFLMIFLSGAPFFAHAQCGMGVPGAGNPGCIPPDVLNQQNQNSTNQQQPQKIVIRHKWADRWGAMVVDDVNPVTGHSVSARNRKEARKLAKNDCLLNGGGGCTNMFTYYNGCAVMNAVMGGGVYYGYGNTLKMAQDEADKQCLDNLKACRVIYSDCSHAEAVPIR